MKKCKQWKNEKVKMKKWTIAYNVLKKQEDPWPWPPI
jgi:hypothetical protein